LGGLPLPATQRGTLESTATGMPLCEGFAPETNRNSALADEVYS
jgi:hypothetical protein